MTMHHARFLGLGMLTLLLLTACGDSGTPADSGVDGGVGADAGPTFACGSEQCSADQYCLLEAGGACADGPDGGPCPQGQLECIAPNQCAPIAYSCQPLGACEGRNPCTCLTASICQPPLAGECGTNPNVMFTCRS